MTWVRHDDQAYKHRKFEWLKNYPDRCRAAEAVWLFWDAVSFCGEQASTGDRSGFIGYRRASSIILADAAPLGELLVEAELFEPAEGGWLVHDIEQYLPPKRDSETQRRNGAKGGKARARNRQKDTQTGQDSSDVASKSLPKSPESRQNESKQRSSETQARASGSGSGSEPSHALPVAPLPLRDGDATQPTLDGEQPSQPPATENARAQALARAYCELVPLSKFPAVMQICKRAIKTGLYSDEQIGDALRLLAAEARPVTVDTLRIQLEGSTATRNGSHQPYVNPPSEAYLS